MADLKTNYVDDVLDTTKNQLRKYQQIQNDDGTFSFVDVTEYTQVGTSFGAKDINDTNAAINDVNGKLNSIVTDVGITFDSHYGTIVSRNLCIINGYLIGCFSLNVTKEIPSENQCLIFRKDAQNVSFEYRTDITLQSDVIKRMYYLPSFIGFAPNSTTIPAGFYIGYICAKTIE